MGGSGDSQLMGNRLLTDLSYAGDIFEINLPDRVELVTELGHFVGGLPSNPSEAGVAVRANKMNRQKINNNKK